MADDSETFKAGDRIECVDEKSRYYGLMGTVLSADGSHVHADIDDRDDDMCIKQSQWEVVKQANAQGSTTSYVFDGEEMSVLDLIHSLQILEQAEAVRAGVSVYRTGSGAICVLIGTNELKLKKSGVVLCPPLQPGVAELKLQHFARAKDWTYTGYHSKLKAVPVEPQADDASTSI